MRASLVRFECRRYAVQSSLCFHTDVRELSANVDGSLLFLCLRAPLGRRVGYARNSHSSALEGTNEKALAVCRFRRSTPNTGGITARDTATPSSPAGRQQLHLGTNSRIGAAEPDAKKIFPGRGGPTEGSSGRATGDEFSKPVFQNYARFRLPPAPLTSCSASLTRAFGGVRVSSILQKARRKSQQHWQIHRRAQIPIRRLQRDS